MPQHSLAHDGGPAAEKSPAVTWGSVLLKGNTLASVTQTCERVIEICIYKPHCKKLLFPMAEASLSWRKTWPRRRRYTNF